MKRGEWMTKCNMLKFDDYLKAFWSSVIKRAESINLVTNETFNSRIGRSYLQRNLGDFGGQKKTWGMHL